MRRSVWVLLAVLVVGILAYAVSTQLGGDDDRDASSSASDPVPTAPSRTAPVPAPSGGSSSETVAPGRPVETVDAGTAKEVTYPGGVTVRIDDVQIIKVKGIGPGQVTGPAAAVKITISNGSTKRINPGSTVVTLLQGKDEQVATPTTAGPAQPFTGPLEPKDSVQGTYVFELPGGKLRSADVVVQYQTGREVARFHL
jgi:hypothetical protein